jgi:uncharacterized membrane protein YsdA (DUF1294 family)
MSENLFFLLFLIYILLNAGSFALYGIDKSRAKNSKSRVSEKNLLIVSFLGPIGALLGMEYFRHKTQKTIFKLLVPIFLIIHIFVIFRIFKLF